MVSDKDKREDQDGFKEISGSRSPKLVSVSFREVFAWLILVAGLSIFGWAIWRLQRADYLAALLAIATGSSVTRASLSLLRPYLSE